jgi:hypothetical protein
MIIKPFNNRQLDMTMPTIDPIIHDLRDKSSWRLLTIVATTYFTSGLIIVAGALLAENYLMKSTLEPSRVIPATSFQGLFVVWDAQWYRRLVDEGYSYDPRVQSSVAFFPTYPLLVSCVQGLTDLGTNSSLLLTSNICFLWAMYLFYAHSLERMEGDTRRAQMALASLALFPTTFFFRMPYSESTMLLISLLVLTGIRRNWPPIGVALLTGLATATRSVGIGLLAPLGLYLLARPVSHRRKALDLFLFIPLGLWGLWAFAYYLGQSFGEPLAFAKVQIHWRLRPAPPLGERIAGLVTLAPVRAFLDPSSDFYWRRSSSWANAPFSLFLANPLYFLFFGGLIVVGAWKRWLDRYELALAAALILIPYAVHSYETSMVSSGRFVALAFPAYLVMGQLLVRLPLAVSSAILGLCSCFMGIYSALFVRWYWIV